MRRIITTMTLDEDDIGLLIEGITMVKGSNTGEDYYHNLIVSQCEQMLNRLQQRKRWLETKGKREHSS